ncbi:MAG: hypothetical protein Q9224_002711 [Gallowayella concinna]
MAPIKIAIVGLGTRTFKKALGAIINNPEHWQLVAAADPVKSQRTLFESRIPNVPVFHDVDQMLAWNNVDYQDITPRIEAVYVAVPHHCYADIIPQLLTARLHILKEKPAATSAEELLLYQHLAKTNSVILSTAGQRRYGTVVKRMKHWLPLIGEVSSIEAILKICITDLGEGWRAQSALAGGGAMADIGWHLVDTVIGLADAGQQSTPGVVYSRLFHIRGAHGHDCEDSAEVILEFPTQPNKMTAHLTVSRIGHKETEDIIITGEKGAMVFDGKQLGVYFETTAGRENLHYDSHQDAEHMSDVGIMFTRFYQQVHSVKAGGLPSVQAEYETHRKQDIIVTRTLHAIYQHAKGPEVEQHQALADRPIGDLRIQEEFQNLAMGWPIIDEAIEAAVSTQLHEGISIYGNGGVFQRFESEFKMYHGASSSHALLHNSGTNALQAMYYAAGFKPGDEVIFPVYTFHATCSPAMHFGIKPVFCDANENGTISAIAIADAITDKTKAVIVTHMWGIPCDMKAINSVLKQRPDILLFEDCSHGHGAKFNGQPVGTFGDGAVWSLQGQKIISGGEGGISLTKHADFHYRQLIFGHYNKRCKFEIPMDHPLREYALTGAGLKNRAHPLAIAIAFNQLRQLPSFHTWKTRYATQLLSKLSGIPFLALPPLDSDNDIEPAWYAFTMRFKSPKAPSGLTREVFVEQLHSRGLVDVDIPSSTGLLHLEPLFNKPQSVLPYIYNENYDVRHQGSRFHEAQAFYNEAIKIPVYATADGQAATDRYVKTILEVALAWMDK